MDKIVFVTGGCSGLGLATVERLHGLGARICVADRDESELDELSKRFKDRLVCVVCDVSKENDVEAAICKAVETFGTIHAAIACAGVTALTPILTTRGSIDMKVFEMVL